MRMSELKLTIPPLIPTCPSLDASLARRILIVLHHQVLPNMTKGRAVRTADWLGEWVDRGTFCFPFPSLST